MATTIKKAQRFRSISSRVSRSTKTPKPSNPNSGIKFQLDRSRVRS